MTDSNKKEYDAIKEAVDIYHTAIPERFRKPPSTKEENNLEEYNKLIERELTNINEK